MFIYNAVLAYNAWIWGIPILIILIGGGLYLSFVTGFVQVRHFPDVLKSTVGGMFNKEEMKEETGKHHGTISSFQAVSAALAAVLGTGNIVGVGTAIAAGGPGAIFWMWIVGFVAMALKYSEACVSIAVREKKPEGGYKGGANYYLSKINKPLGFAWSIAMIYGLITAAGVHTGSVVTACESLGIPRLVATIVVCIIIALIIFGGIQALVQITERLVPFMAAIYIIAGLAVVVLNIGNLIPAIVSIFKGAFTGTAAIGGFAGATISAAIRNGCARGVYSSDAGNGQSSIAYSQSSETDPVKQGMWGIFEVFFDTIVVCTFTALVILCTGVWQTGEAGSTLAITAFTSALGGVGKVIASIGLMMFAGSTVLAFCTFIGLTCENVFGKTGRWIGQIGFVILAFVGGMVGVDILLGWADFGNSLTLTLNIIGLLGFSKKIAQWTRNYFEKGNSFAE